MARILFIAILAIATAVAGVLTQQSSAVPTSVDAESYVSKLYSPSPPPAGVTGAKLTSLASALYPLQTSWAAHPMITSDRAALASAASRAADPTSAASIVSDIHDWKAIREHDWYKEFVPCEVKSDIDAYNSAWESAAEKILGTPKPTSTNGAHSAACTGMAMAAAAAGVALGVVANM
ncbi:hypothetical protein B0H63DRAFT_450554 [Podospora didyma]|uniref:Infection structure specific protein n=1 Tax=Podospora didyma TaxID=330526 RepID=A0AAE0TVP8_9PEZI|nr:hypothetical protein B0H63DRAFT_450554 [Podospora didyma]